MLFVRPGKPTQNAFIESFNSRVRDELLAPNRFRAIFEARVAAEYCVDRTTPVTRTAHSMG